MLRKVGALWRFSAEGDALGRDMTIKETDRSTAVAGMPEAHHTAPLHTINASIAFLQVTGRC